MCVFTCVCVSFAMQAASVATRTFPVATGIILVATGNVLWSMVTKKTERDFAVRNKAAVVVVVLCVVWFGWAVALAERSG